MLPSFCGRLLAGGANAGKLEGMAQGGVPAFLGDLAFEALDHAFVDGLDFVAGAADEVMMMVMAILRLDFVAGGAIDPGDALDEFFFFEDRDEAEDGGEVAAARADFLVNIGEGEGDGTGIEQLDDGDAAMGRAQAVLAQPSGGVDRVRMIVPVFAHSYLYHRKPGWARMRLQ